MIEEILSEIKTAEKARRKSSRKPKSAPNRYGRPPMNSAPQSNKRRGPTPKTIVRRLWRRRKKARRRNAANMPPKRGNYAPV